MPDDLVIIFTLFGDAVGCESEIRYNLSVCYNYDSDCNDLDL